MQELNSTFSLKIVDKYSTKRYYNYKVEQKSTRERRINIDK